MLTPEIFKQRSDQRFADNEFFRITEKTYRDQGDDMLATFVPLAEANVPAYDPTRFYAEEYLVTFDGFYYRAKVQGFLPAPTPGQETDEWKPDFKPLPALLPYRELPVLQGQDFASDGLLEPSKLYRLTGRVDADGEALADVLVVALSRHTVAGADAYTISIDPQTREEQLLAVSYELATDTTSPRTGGGGGGYTKAEVDALLAAIKLTAEPVTYSQLTQKVAQGSLRPGNYYRLTDFQLTHTIPNTTQVATSAPEPLLLLAISSGLLRPEGYSLGYPGDIVYYRLDNNQSAMPGCTRGFIYRRHDTVQNNDLEIDFRNVVFRRWLEPLPYPDFSGATSAYLACKDNGAAWQDSVMFANYSQTRNNQWLGFDQSYSASIFGSLNYVADSSSRTVNTRLTNSSIVNVTLAGGSWFFNSYLISSALREVRAPRMQFYNFFQSTMVNTSVADRFVAKADTGSTLIASTITTQDVYNKCFVGGKDVSQLGAGADANVPARLQLVTDQGLRVAALAVESNKFVLSGVRLFDLAGQLNMQLNQRVDGNWRPGTQQPLDAINAAIAALTPDEVEAGVELELETVQTGQVANQFTALLTVTGLSGFSLLRGTRPARRVFNPNASPEPQFGFAFNAGSTRNQCFSFPNPTINAGCVTFWLKRNAQPSAGNEYWMLSARPANSSVYVAVDGASQIDYHVETVKRSNSQEGAPAGQWVRVVANLPALQAGQISLFSGIPGSGAGPIQIEIYDVRFYSRRFDAMEIGNRTVAPQDSLLARFTFPPTMSTDTSVVLDESGNNNNGTLYNF